MNELSYFAQLNELFQEWMHDLSGEDRNLFCKDGLMLKAYKTEKSIDTLWDESPRRVMFILKDKNTPDGDDTRLWPVDGKHGIEIRELCGGNIGQTGFFPNIARILYGLTVQTIGYSQLEMQKVKDNWNALPFAFVEAKKLAGYSSVKSSDIENALKKDGEFLMREIDILNPNILVCCDADDTQFNYITQQYDSVEKGEIISIEYKYPIKPCFTCCLRYYPTINKVVIKSYHPTRIGKAGDWIIYEKVVSPFRQLLNNYQIDLK